MPATGKHVWGEWVVDKLPVGNQAGEGRRECSDCHTAETREMYQQADATGVRIIYPEGAYGENDPPELYVTTLVEGERSKYAHLLLEMSEESDGALAAYQISLAGDAQPELPVIVWIPVPNGVSVHENHVMVHVNPS